MHMLYYTGMRKNLLVPFGFLSLIIVTFFLLFFHLGATTLTNWDEAWFAAVAQDMITRKEFLNGNWNGTTWFYEPSFLSIHKSPHKSISGFLIVLRARFKN